MNISLGVKVFQLSTMPSQVKLSQALSFLVEAKKYEQYLSTLDKDLSNVDEINYLKLISSCIAAFFDVSINDVLNTRVRFTQQELTTSLENCGILFQLLSNIISSYQPKTRERYNCEFIHNEQRYQIPYYLVSDDEKVLSNDLTVGQSIECLEVKRLINEHKKKDWKNATFTEIIKLLAILARPLNENGVAIEFPNEQSKIDSFIKKQEKIFVDIDMETGFDVAFFLTFFINR